MKSQGPRTPFDHIKDIYGEKMEKYSYQEMRRDPKVSRKAFLENNNKGNGRYNAISGKILEFLTLVFIFFMLGIGVYFILTGIVSS